MNKKIEIDLTPEEAFDEVLFKPTLYQKLKLNQEESFLRPVRRSIDARGKNILVKVQVEILPVDQQIPISYNKDYSEVSNNPRVIIVGAGPAGLFAAIRLIESGMKPIIFERGKDVQSRR